VVKVENPDGSVTIQIGDVSHETKPDRGFYENLAQDIDKSELSRIAEEIWTGVQEDDRSRSEWLDNRTKVLKLLGLKIEAPRGDVSSSAPLEGMSSFRHPLLLEAVLRGQANARGELLPAGGPVKVRSFGEEDEETMGLANDLESDLNYDLTVAQSHYYPDTDQMLFSVYSNGCAFKKVYHCPIRNRPVSESVDASDLIVSNATTDLKNCKRVTHVIKMRQATLRRMQIAGAYRDISITRPPAQQPTTPIEREKADIQGVKDQPQRPEDQDYTIYESYVELDLKGYEHKDDGKVTGLAVPYRITMEKETKEILEIRRHWDEDDKMCLSKTTFVKYPYVRGLGFYDIGLGHILGNTTVALTAMTREAIDLGMFSNFPGFLYTETVARQLTNEMRVPPGGGLKVQTGGQPLSNHVMPLPYKSLDSGFLGVIQAISTDGQRLGGVAEIQVGEGRADVPVGTTIALIEQATKVESAVHKRQHAAQAEEFGILKELFREDPDALTRTNPRSKLAKRFKDLPEKERRQKIIEALDNSDLVPVGDPNTPTRLHRVMLVQAVKQLQAGSPDLYDGRKVDSWALQTIGIGDPESIFNQQPPQQQPDPKLLAIQAKQQSESQSSAVQLQEVQLKQATSAAQIQDRAAERASRERIEEMKLEIEKIRLQIEGMVHRDDHQVAVANTVSERQMHQESLAADQAKHLQGLHVDNAQHLQGLHSEHIKHQNQLANDRELARLQAQRKSE
jgi:hypothetical protein